VIPLLIVGPGERYRHASDEERQALGAMLDSTTFARLEFWTWCALNRTWFDGSVVGLA
jgi:hypothetical protein